MSAPNPNPLENVVEAYLCRRVRAAGGQTIKLVSLNKGTPDRLVLLPGGYLYLVETKRPKGGKLSPAQELFISRAARMGTRVEVLSSTDEVNDWLEAHWERHDHKHDLQSERR